MKNPKFSILIPAYKGKYLDFAVSSCVNQTFSDWELVIVDDASPEDLRSIVSRYSDPRIKYFRNNHNCGAINVVDNWNVGLSYCSGEWVICMGDDDVLSNSCLSQYEKLISKYPQLNVLHALTEIIDETGTVTKRLGVKAEYEGCMSMIWTHWNGEPQYIGDFCYRISHLRNKDGFFKMPLAWGSDHITAIRAADVQGIGNTQEVGFQYRENRYTISRGGNSRLKLEAKLKEKEWFVDFIKSYVPNDGIENESILWEKIKATTNVHYKQEYYQYLKEYFQESPLNYFKVIGHTDKYNINLLELTMLFFRVVRFLYLTH